MLLDDPVRLCGGAADEECDGRDCDAWERVLIESSEVCHRGGGGGGTVLVDEELHPLDLMVGAPLGVLKFCTAKLGSIGTVSVTGLN